MEMPENTILPGDCIQILDSLPPESVDLIFADPPYNLQLQKELHRPDMSRVDGVDDAWDQFGSFQEYDAFTTAWLSACRRVLKPAGSIWVNGTYHNIFRVGRIMQDLGFWILNDVVWIKTNPMPNFRGVRFTNAHETLIWASKSQGSRYTFNHHAMKSLNDDLQMRSDWWLLPLATGSERLKDENGAKAHTTQKPEALLYRIILASSQPGDLVLDPFMGSGTTGVAAKRLRRRWLGIEKDEKYRQLALQRIEQAQPPLFEEEAFDLVDKKKLAPRVSFSTLVENGLLPPGQVLYFQQDKTRSAVIKADARLRLADGFEGSIHMAGRHWMNEAPCNGWVVWYFEEEGVLKPIDVLRQKYLQEGEEP